MDKNQKSRSEKDDFWDLSSLVPKPKRPLVSVPKRSSVDTTEVQVIHRTAPQDGVYRDQPLTERPLAPRPVTPPPRPQPRSTPLRGAQSDIRPLPQGRSYRDVPLTERPVASVPAAEPPKPQLSYTPQSSLVREVRIYAWENRYNYYEQFRQHAELLANKEGQECPEAEFFSYMPQYSQMNRQQLAYYLWWRTNFRRRTCLPASYSYLLLYLYELINLDAAHQNVQVGRDSMVRLWLSYREKYPKLDVLIREWLCDFCLLHRLPPPSLDPALYRTLLSGCNLKEFYVTAGEDGSALGRALLLFCNNYDYTKSKFYNEETKADYDRVLRGAVDETVRFLRESSGEQLTDATGVSTVSRDAFAGAICSYRLKRRIEVDYTSFSHTHELRYVMTDVLKYAENALRQSRGIKSRLSIYSVSVPLRQRLDAYLAGVLPKKQSRAAQSREIPDYERHYDLPVTELSPERAAAIEAESWQTTKRLVEAFAGEETEITPQTVREKPASAPEPPPAAPVQPLPVTPSTAAALSPLAEALGDLAAFLPLARSGDRAAQREFARSRGLMVDAIADKINTVTGDILGDIVLEQEGDAYVIIEDYLDFLTDQGVL